MKFPASLFKRSALVYFVIFTTGLLISSCSKDPEKVVKVSSLGKSMDVERATGVSMTYTDSGLLRARIFAPLMERYPQKTEPYLEMKKGVKAYFYDKNGEVESSLSAEYAISYERKKLVEVRRHVKVRNIQNEEMETEKLTWDQRRELIYTDNFVKIKTQDEILYGTGFESDQNFTRYRIRHLKGRVSMR